MAQETFNVRSLIHRLRATSPLTKGIAATYLLGFATYDAFHTYNNGKQALLRFRNGESFPARVKTEYDAVRWGCDQDCGTIFFKSLVWPAVIASEFVPNIVVKLNPPAKQ